MILDININHLEQNYLRLQRLLTLLSHFTFSMVEMINEFCTEES